MRFKRYQLQLPKTIFRKGNIIDEVMSNKSSILVDAPKLVAIQKLRNSLGRPTGYRLLNSKSLLISGLFFSVVWRENKILHDYSTWFFPTDFCTKVSFLCTDLRTELGRARCLLELLFWPSPTAFLLQLDCLVLTVQFC